MLQHIPHEPEFDQARAEALIGKYVLVGIAYEDAQSNVVEQQQVHGRVTSVDREQGITMLLEGVRAGESFVLPPDLTPFYSAAPGRYSLRSTGEDVLDPDWLVTWTVRRPEPRE